jgi:putative tryptophan/tyrosine transport system substrate-binding protein
VADGQQGMPVIGFLSSSSSILTTKRIASFNQGLSEAGYVAGRDFMIEPRLAEGQTTDWPHLQPIS